MKTNSAYIPALRFNALTPFYDLMLSWGMAERRFKYELIRRAQIQPGHHVLDLGCGTATLTMMLKRVHPDAVVTGLDGDEAVLAIGRAKAKTAGVDLKLDQGLADQLPYPDGSFDRVVSSLMFHHLTTQNKHRAMKEIHRVLHLSGSVWIVDFGPPRGAWSRLVSTLMARLEEVGDNHKGMLATMLRLAGFHDVSSRVHFQTIFGTLSLYTGQKADI